MHDESLNLPAKTDFSRRGFVMTSLAAGFALSVQPVTAQTISTDTTGLEAGEVKIPVSDGEIPAYRALPEKGGPFPVILVVQEIFGVHEHIKDICRRLAKLGYLAIAPELYARQGDVSKITDFREIFSKVVSKVPDKQVMSDLDAAVAWAKGTGKGDVAKLGITGYCWGGRIVWLYAAHNPDLKAGVAWYGRLVGDADELHPKHPIDRGRSRSRPLSWAFMARPTRGSPWPRSRRCGPPSKRPARPPRSSSTPKRLTPSSPTIGPSYRKDKAEDGWKHARVVQELWRCVNQSHEVESIMACAATLVVAAPPNPGFSRVWWSKRRAKQEPREPPIEPIHALRPPRAGFPYFAHADHFPFEPEAVASSAVNAWWLADASDSSTESHGMVTVERATTPDLEKRTRLLAAVLIVLGGLAILAPLMAGANAESRVGLLLILAGGHRALPRLSALERRGPQGGVAEWRGHGPDGHLGPQQRHA